MSSKKDSAICQHPNCRQPGGPLFQGARYCNKHFDQVTDDHLKNFIGPRQLITRGA